MKISTEINKNTGECYNFENLTAFCCIKCPSEGQEEKYHLIDKI